MLKPKSFQPKHGTSNNKSYNGRAKSDALYDSDWEKYRGRFLFINNKCYSCGEKSTVCDHMVPHKGDETLFKKTDNHLPLCARCHNTITAKFDKYFRPGSMITEKLKWMAANRLRNCVETKVRVLPSYL